MHLPNVIIPLFWIDSRTQLQDFMLDTLYNTFVVIPKAISITKYVTLVVAIICFAISFWCRFEKTAKESRKNSAKGPASRRHCSPDTSVNMEQGIAAGENLTTASAVESPTEQIITEEQ